MKTKDITKTGKTVVQRMRDIRDKVNHDIQDMTYEQLLEYLKNQKMLHNKHLWQK